MNEMKWDGMGWDRMGPMDNNSFSQDFLSCPILSCLPNTRRHRQLAQDSFVLVLYWGMLYINNTCSFSMKKILSRGRAFLYLFEALGTVICLYMTRRIRDNGNVTCSPKLTCTGKMLRFDMYARCTNPKAAS